MATTIYFVKATYTDNVYKLSDFYVGTSYKLDVNKSMPVDMAFNDGPTMLETQTRKLPDGTDMRTYTHIIVPHKKKIYRIDRIDEPNYDSYKIYLDDDPLIANYHNFKDKNMVLSRSNDYEKAFIGVHDVSDLSTEYDVTTSIPNDVTKGVLSGDWLLLFIQALNEDQLENFIRLEVDLNFGTRYNNFNAITVKDLDELFQKYPSIDDFIDEFSGDMELPWYYGKKAKLENGEEYYYSVYKLSNSTILTWIKDNPFYKTEHVTVGVNEFQQVDSNLEEVTSSSPVDKQGIFYESDTGRVIRRSKIGGLFWHTGTLLTNVQEVDSLPANPELGKFYAIPKISGLYDLYKCTNTSSSSTVNNFETKYKLMVNMTKGQFKSCYVNAFPNQPIAVIAMPMFDRIGNGITNLLSASSFNSISYVTTNGGTETAKTLPILATKIVNGSILYDLFDSSVTVPVYNLSEDDSLRSVIMQPSNIKTFPTYYNKGMTNLTSVRLAFIRNQNVIKNISLNDVIGNVLEYEPFVKYELMIYGQKFEVPAKYVNSLYMRQNITPNGLSIMVYLDENCSNQYISTLVSFDSVWSAEQLELYASTNPTFKDEYQVRRQQQWTNTLVSGVTNIGTSAIAGTMAGGPVGAVVGAGLGLATNIIGTAVNQYHEEQLFNLSQKSMKLQNDQLYGNTSSSDQMNNNRSGIYWVIKTSKQMNEMVNQYNLKGFPTNKLKKITDLGYISNNVFNAQAKIVSGFFKNTIINPYITAKINEKLSNTVIFIE